MHGIRAAGAVAAAATLFVIAPSAFAQPGFGGLFGAAQNRSNPLGTLMRPEVQTHLRLDLKQKNAIAALLDKAAQERREQRRQLFQGFAGPGRQQGLSREEQQQQRQEQAQQRAQVMRESMQRLEGELSEEIKQILRPEQLKRLYELDLQRRGPLALADARIQEQVKLSDQTRTEVGKIAAEFQAQVQQAVQEAFEGLRPDANAQPGQPGRGQGRPNFQEMQARIGPLQARIEKMRKEAEDRILAVLTPEERARWNEATGPAFTFRKDQPAPGPFGGFRGPGQGRRPF